MEGCFKKELRLNGALHWKVTKAHKKESWKEVPTYKREKYISLTRFGEILQLWQRLRHLAKFQTTLAQNEDFGNF